MKAKLGLVCGLVLVSASAFAGQFQCDVNCVSRSGSIQQTSVTVSAGSASEAASIVDNNGNKICRDANFERATSSSVSSSQCSRK